ncbi:MAG TPA: hypothetical protein VEB69_01235 [Acidimicrobiia bacterium]|nr:hypothetical protein [Acidimicrobiia bacterium]
MAEMVASFAELWHEPMGKAYASAYLDPRVVFYINKEGLDALHLRVDHWFISVRSPSLMTRRLAIL